MKIFSVVLVLFSYTCQAQPYFDVAAFRFHHLPAGNNDATLETNWLQAEISLPKKIKEDVFVVSPFFEMYDFSFGNNVYGFALPLTYVKQWKKEKWKTAFTVIPRLNSDLKNISSDDYQAGAAVLFTYKKKENLKFKFGTYYNSEFFGFFMLPLAGIDWNISERLNLFGILPNSMNIEYKALLKKIHCGLSFKSVTNSFRYENESYLKVQDNHIKIYADAYLLKHVVLNIEAGHTVWKKYSVGFDDDENKLGFKNNFIFRMALSYRLRLDEKQEN